MNSCILLVASPMAFTVMLFSFPSMPEMDMGISSVPGIQIMTNCPGLASASQSNLKVLVS